jgi:hypothetical protein
MPLLYCRYGRGREVDRGARGLGKPSRAEEIPPPTTPTTTNGFYNTNSWGVDLFQSIRPRRSPCCLCLMQFNLRVSLCKRGVVPHRAWTAARSPPYITLPGGFLRCDPSHLYTIIFIIAVRTSALAYVYAYVYPERVCTTIRYRAGLVRMGRTGPAQEGGNEP